LIGHHATYRRCFFPETSWFQEPEGDNQPARPFWGLTPDSIEASKALLDARFATA
jgi:hypothetical protein